MSASSFGERVRACIAFVALVAVDVLMKAGGFRAVHRLVQRWRVRPRGEPDLAAARILAGSVDRAARWYLKRAWCLQRSVVAACLLRSRGIPAELVIGVRKMPFLAHAWVELDGVVVNDTPDVQQVFTVMERCRP